jgi:Fe-S-cluster containining protein
MSYNDSFDKIVHYFACVTTQPFTYKNKEYDVKLLHVSPGIIRGYKCPGNCGGCCQKFTLDYIPQENPSVQCKERIVEFNGKQYSLLTDLQKDNKTDRCRYLNKEDGRCNTYETRPFTCDFELIRFMGRKEKNHVTNRLFGRGWNMARVDGLRGAKCEITPADEESRKDTIRKLYRLKEWSDYFGLETKLPTVIAWCNMISFNETQPLLI